MKFLILLLLLSATCLSQQLNFDYCNDHNNIAARNSCLKENVHALLVSEIQKTKFVKVTDNPVTLTVEILVDQLGNFHVVSSESENKSLELKAISTMARIRPIKAFKNYAGDMLYDSFIITMTFPIVETELSEILPQTKHATDENLEVPFAIIERAPIYPGCYQDNNAALKKCMSENVTKHVIGNFNTHLASSLNLRGVQRISVQFKIDRNGFVTNVHARGPHPTLESEAHRVVSSLPKMEPGKQKGTDVGVLYSLPILFKVEETLLDKKARLKRERKAKRKNRKKNS